MNFASRSSARTHRISCADPMLLLIKCYAPPFSFSKLLCYDILGFCVFVRCETGHVIQDNNVSAGHPSTTREHLLKELRNGIVGQVLILYSCCSHGADVMSNCRLPCCIWFCYELAVFSLACMNQHICQPTRIKPSVACHQAVLTCISLMCVAVSNRCGPCHSTSYRVQDVALKDISLVLHQYLTGWLPSNKPLVLLFAGPSRCGKTEAAEQISRILTKQPPDRQFFLNMGQFALEHDVANLNGAPQGYAGSDKDGRLAALDGVKNPIVVLDEIEKAHARALDFFLSVFDKGQFSTTAGKVIDCKSAIFIMTSNIGQQLLTERADYVWGLSDEARRVFEGKEIRPQFEAHGWRPEFLTRIRMCVPFLPFSTEQQVEVARHFLKVSILYLPSQPEIACFIQHHCVNYVKHVHHKLPAAHGCHGDTGRNGNTALCEDEQPCGYMESCNGARGSMQL